MGLLPLILLRLVLLAIIGLTQLVVGRAALRIIGSFRLKDSARSAVRVTTLLVIALLNLPLLYFALETFISPHRLMLYAPLPESEWLMRPIDYVFFVWIIGSIFFCVFSPVAMAGMAGLRAWKAKSTRAEQSLDMSRRRFLRYAMVGMASAPFAASAYGAVSARYSRSVEYIRIPVKDLPAGLEGFRILQMSDIHSSIFMTEHRMREFADTANDLSPDLIALTGDFVASDKGEAAPFFRAMSDLKASYGVFGCMGNHDLFTDAGPALTAGFDQAGFQLLRGQNRVVDVNGAKLNIVGIDFFDRRHSLDPYLRGISLEGTTILLLHSPEHFPEAAKKGIDLTLSGHTHGGQIVLKLGSAMFTPARIATPFLAGLFKIGTSHLYVNRGLGTTGPPIRINAPPEITVLTLTRA